MDKINTTAKEEAIDFFCKKRNPNTHKGNYGRVYIIAGSPGMTGAASFCAKAALRAGCGLVYIMTKKASLPIYEVLVPEAVKKTICGNDYDFFVPEDVDEIIDNIVDASCVVLGPGLGNNHKTAQFVRRFVKKYNVSGLSMIPLILDADALNSYSGKRQELSLNLPHNSILTPHVMEASRISGDEVTQINENRALFTDRMARELKTIFVLKGNKTLISNGEVLYVNDSGNAGMATAGSGDMLCGIIAGFIATDYGNVSLFDCVRFGVYIHGYCGDLAAIRYGQRFITAPYIIEQLGEIDNGKI